MAPTCRLGALVRVGVRGTAATSHRLRIAGLFAEVGHLAKRRLGGFEFGVVYQGHGDLVSI